MNSLQIQYFITVAEQGGFSEAARKLYISQPAVSKQIRLLEKELGYQLFLRNGKKTALTHAGEAFLDYFRQCQFQMDLTQNRLREQTMNGRSPIRIGYLEGMDLTHFLPQMQQAIARLDVSVYPELSCYALPQLLTSLHEGSTDLILTFGSMLTHEAFFSMPLTSVSRVLLYSSARFPEPVYDISHFRREIFFLPEDEHTSRLEQVLHDTFLEYGFAPRIVYAPNFTTIMDRVERGEGVFVYNEWCRQCSQSGFGHLSLPSSQMLYLTRKDIHTSPELIRFFDEMKNSAAS